MGNLSGLSYFDFLLLFFILGGALHKTVIPLALVRYEIIKANLALRVSLVIYRLISNARSWNNC